MPESPDAYHHPIPDLPISRFSIPVKFLISALEHEVNYHVGEVLYEDRNPTDDQIIMTVVKSGRLTLWPDGHAVNYKFPIRIEVTYYPQKGSSKRIKSFCYELMVDFSSTFGIGTDWQLLPRTTYSGFEWVSKPDLDSNEVDIDVAKWIERGINRQSDLMGSNIDLFLRQHLDLKTVILEAWDQIQVPIDAPAMKVWFLPQSVSVTPLSTVGENVQLLLHIMLYTSVQPKTSKSPSKKMPLPEPLIIDMIADTGFVAHISNKITYSQMDTLLTRNMGGHPIQFDNGKQQVALSEFKCFASGDRLIIKAKLSGSLSGIVFIRSTPHLDTIKQAICLQHIDFELKTKDILALSAAWMMNGSIEAKIQKAFEIPYREKMLLAKKHINKKMERIMVGDNVEMRTNVLHINPHTVFVAHDFVELRSTVRGNMDVFLY